MKDNTKEQAVLADQGGCTPSFMEERIRTLKIELEEKLATPMPPPRWVQMFEDCEIILSHFEQDKNAKQKQAA
jgi:hypothetical protein